MPFLGEGSKIAERNGDGANWLGGMIGKAVLLEFGGKIPDFPFVC